MESFRNNEKLGLFNKNRKDKKGIIKRLSLWFDEFIIKEMKFEKVNYFYKTTYNLFIKSISLSKKYY